jgi:phosphomevalonate kinase
MNILSTSMSLAPTLDQFRIDDRKNGLLKEDGTPLVQEIPKFLSEKECDTLIQFAEEKGFEKPNFGKSRICERLHTVNEDLSTWVLNRLREYLPEKIKIDDVEWSLSRFTHHWRYVHYYPGGHFAPHYDGSKMLPWKEMSVFTVQIYLNEGFSGGNTRFYLDYSPDRLTPRQVSYGIVKQFNPNKPTHETKPETGKALVFNHTENTLHDGEPVMEGEKYILRGDVLYTACEEDYEKLENSTIPPELRMWSNEAARRGDTKSYAGEIWHCQCGDDLCGIKEIPAPSIDYTVKENKLSSMRVILISGKRAVGKDYIADKIQQSLEKLHLKVYRTSLGTLNKQLYAQKNNIDFNRLEKDRRFKEDHRVAMIMHHTKMDESNPEWAVKSVLQDATAKNADVLLVSDIRRLKDLEWFQSHSPSVPMMLRITANNQARLMHGWDPDAEKDQLPTEVELDIYKGWSSLFENSDISNDSEKKVEEWIQSSVVLPLVLDSSRSNSSK